MTTAPITDARRFAGLRDALTDLRARDEAALDELVQLREQEATAVADQDAESLQRIWKRREEVRECRDALEAEHDAIMAEGHRRLDSGAKAWQQEATATVARWRQEQAAQLARLAGLLDQAAACFEAINTAPSQWREERERLVGELRQLKAVSGGFPYDA